MGIAQRHPGHLFVHLCPWAPGALGYPESQVAGFLEPHAIRATAHAPVGHHVDAQWRVAHDTWVPGIRMDLRIDPAGGEGVDDPPVGNVAGPVCTSILIAGNEELVGRALQDLVIPDTEHHELIHRPFFVAVGSIDVYVAVLIMLVVPAHLQDAQKRERLARLVEEYHVLFASFLPHFPAYGRTVLIPPGATVVRGIDELCADKAGTGLVEQVVGCAEEVVDAAIGCQDAEPVVPGPIWTWGWFRQQVRIPGQMLKRVLGRVAMNGIHSGVVEVSRVAIHPGPAAAVTQRHVLLVVVGPGHVPIVAGLAGPVGRLFESPNARDLCDGYSPLLRLL